jgi:hypothetical protein
MLHGLLWTPKPRRKRFSYRLAAARLVALGLLTAAPKVFGAPLNVQAGPHRLRRRLKGNFLATRGHSPLQYHLAQATFLLPPGSGRRPLTTLARPPLGGRSPLVPLRYAPSSMSVAMLTRPMRASLRLFYLLLATPANGAITPLQVTKR